jgi:copper homeostasis protein CutC
MVVYVLCSQGQVADCIKRDLSIADLDGVVITALDTDGSSLGSAPLTSLSQLQYDIDGRCHIGLEVLGDGSEAEAAATALLESVAAMPPKLTTEGQRAAAIEAAGQLKAMLAAAS